MHLVGVTNLLPGPNSSEVAIHIGYTQRGWLGAMATGLAFLVPTLVLVTFFSFLYFNFGSLPAVEGLFWGLKPAILAVILGAGWKLGKTALGVPEHPDVLLAVLAVGGILTALFLDGMEVPAMVLGGSLSWMIFRRKVPPSTPSSPPLASLALLPLGAAAGLWTLPTMGVLSQLFLTMLGAGSVLFGGGYMLVALLEPFVVQGFGWLSPTEFLDGIALTQAMPGPIVTLVAFVGFKVAGVWGAVLATCGIYIPSFLAVLAVAPHLEKWREVEGFRAALKGVNAVVAGAILGVGLSLLESGLPDVWAGALFLLALLGIIRFRVPAVWVVVGGLLMGGLHLALGG